MSHVTRTEILFLDMFAKRMFKFAKDAKAKGTTFVDTAPPTPLGCGVYVKVRYEPVEGSPDSPYRAIVSFADRTKEPSLLKEIAQEILAGRKLNPIPILREQGSVVEFHQDV